MPGTVDTADLTPLESALLLAVETVERESIPYMIIGGAALNLWGYTRPTKDVDLTIWVEPEREARAVQALVARLAPRVPDPEAFVARSRVLLVRTPDGVGVDLTFGSLPWEQAAIQRSVAIRIHDRTVRVGSVADLAFQKALAGRPQDLADLRYLITRHADAIDRPTLDGQIRELATALDRPDLLREYLACWKD